MPGNFRLGICVEIDVDEPVGIDVDVDWEELNGGWVECRYGFRREARSFGQFTVQVVGPSVIFARKDSGCAARLLDHGKGAMPVENGKKKPGVSDGVQVARE